MNFPIYRYSQRSDELESVWLDTQRFPELAERIYRHNPAKQKQRFLDILPASLATGGYTGRREDTSEVMKDAQRINRLIVIAKKLIKFASLKPRPLGGLDLVLLDTRQVAELAKRIHSFSNGAKAQRFLAIQPWALATGDYTGRSEDMSEVEAWSDQLSTAFEYFGTVSCESRVR